MQTESNIFVIFWFTERFDDQRKMCTFYSFLSEAETSTDINTSEFPYIACFLKQTKLLESVT